MLAKCSEVDDAKANASYAVDQFLNVDLLGGCDKNKIVRILSDCSKFDDSKNNVASVIEKLVLRDFFAGYSANQIKPITEVLVRCGTDSRGVRIDNASDLAIRVVKLLALKRLINENEKFRLLNLLSDCETNYSDY